MLTAYKHAVWAKTCCSKWYGLAAATAAAAVSVSLVQPSLLTRAVQVRVRAI